MSKNLIALPIVLLMALSITGLAVAHWSDEIYINGKVEMGSLTFAFLEVEPPVEYHWKGGVRYLGEALNKSVATTTSWLTGNITDVHSGKWGFEKMHILVENGYPCYEVHSTFVVRNIGTIALDVTAMTIEDPTGTLTFNGTGTLDDPWLGIDKRGEVVLNIWSINLVGEQFEPCNVEKAELDLHIKQDAEECHTYEFEVTIEYEQYDP